MTIDIDLTDVADFVEFLPAPFEWDCQAGDRTVHCEQRDAEGAAGLTRSRSCGQWCNASRIAVSVASPGGSRNAATPSRRAGGNASARPGIAS